MRRRRRAGGVVHALTLALAAGLILFTGWGLAQATRAEKAYTPNNLMKTQPDVIPANATQSYTPANTIRLHIPANSDDGADQAAKEEVRDALMAAFGDRLLGTADVKEAEKILKSELGEIERVAEDCLRKCGFTYGVTAAVKKVHFPEKTYELASGETVCLPQGEYTALQVVLGKGEGKNWWCVMYPPLCYFDLVQRGVIPGVAASAPGMPSGEGGSRSGILLVDESATEEVKVEVRSLIVDAIKAGMIRLSEALSFLAETSGGRAQAADLE